MKKKDHGKALCHLVIFGASGDLVSRLLLPGLAELHASGELPEGFRIVGVDIADLTTSEFRAHMAGELAEHASDLGESSRAAIINALDYAEADVTDPHQVEAAISDIDSPMVAYLALP